MKTLRSGLINDKLIFILMIKSNSFYIKNLKNVVFIGEHGSLKRISKNK